MPTSQRSLWKCLMPIERHITPVYQDHPWKAAEVLLLESASMTDNLHECVALVPPSSAGLGGL